MQPVSSKDVATERTPEKAPAGAAKGLPSHQGAIENHEDSHNDGVEEPSRTEDLSMALEGAMESPKPPEQSGSRPPSRLARGDEIGVFKTRLRNTRNMQRGEMREQKGEREREREDKIL